MRTGRPRSFDRDEVLDRAVTVFWQHGYDTTSMAMLVSALGIGAPSIYAAFGDKQSLFLEAVDHYLKTYGAFTVRALTDEPEARDAVQRLLHDAASAYTRPDRPPGCLMITAATNSTPQSEDIAARLRAHRAAGLRALEDKIAAAARTGELPAHTDAHALATYYSATLQGMSAQARDGATTADLEHIAEAALKAWPETEHSQR